MYVIGTRTLADIVLDIAKSNGNSVEGFFDDHSGKTHFSGIKIIGKVEDLFANPEEFRNEGVFVAIGDNMKRADIYSRLISSNIKLINVIHPSAHVESSVRMETGNLILSGVTIGSNSKIGSGNLIFPGVSITHHNIIGNYNFISPNVSIGGYTELQSNCKIGMNSVVKPYIRVVDGYSCDPLTLVDGEKIDAK